MRHALAGQLHQERAVRRAWVEAGESGVVKFEPSEVRLAAEWAPRVGGSSARTRYPVSRIGVRLAPHPIESYPRHCGIPELRLPPTYAAPRVQTPFHV